MIASARGLSSPPSWSYHSSNSYWEQKIVEDFLRLRWSSSKISLCSESVGGVREKVCKNEPLMVVLVKYHRRFCYGTEEERSLSRKT